MYLYCIFYGVTLNTAAYSGKARHAPMAQAGRKSPQGLLPLRVARVLQAAASRGVGRVLPQLNLLVVLIDEDHPRVVIPQLGIVENAVTDDDHQVAGADQPGGRAVDADDPAATLAGDGIGGQPVAVIDIDDVDLLALEEVCGVHQVCVDGAGTHVVQVGLGDRRAVDL